VGTRWCVGEYQMFTMGVSHSLTVQMAAVCGSMAALGSDVDCSERRSQSQQKSVEPYLRYRVE